MHTSMQKFFYFSSTYFKHQGVQMSYSNTQTPEPVLFSFGGERVEKS